MGGSFLKIPVQSIDFEVFFYFYEVPFVHGVFSKSEEVGATPAVGTAEVFYGPAGNFGESVGQFMFQVFFSTDRDGTYEAAGASQVVHVPVPSFPKGSVVSYALVQIFSGRSYVNVEAFGKMDISQTSYCNRFVFLQL